MNLRVERSTLNLQFQFDIGHNCGLRDAGTAKQPGSRSQWRVYLLELVTLPPVGKTRGLPDNPLRESEPADDTTVAQ